MGNAGFCPYQQDYSRIWGLLGGSWVVISGVRSRVTIVITHIQGFVAPLKTTHEPPSRV